MPSFVSALLLTTFFFAVMAVAIPIIDKLGSARMPRRKRPASVRDQAAMVATGPAFTPLQMGDSGQKWPSQVPSRRTALVMPAWPSETWEDNPFPASGVIAQQLVDTPPRSQSTPMATAQRQATPEPVQARPPTPRAQPKRKPQPKPQRSRRTPTPVDVAQSMPAAQDGPPEPAVILQIANDPSRGLAPAVDFVRQTTGWSFQRAAQHVASVLRSTS